MQIIFAAKLHVIRLAKTRIIHVEIYLDEFQAWLEY